MRAHGVEIKPGYRLFLAHLCTLKKWRPEVWTLQCPLNGQGRSVTTVVQVTTSAKPVCNRREENLMGSCGALRLLSMVRVRGSPSGINKLFLLSSATVDELIPQVPSASSRRSFRLVPDLHFGVLGDTQSVENISTSDLKDTLEEGAVLALKEYLCNVKGTPAEDAELISRSCPMFISKLTAVLRSNCLEKGATLQSCMSIFLDKEDKEASNKLEPSLETREESSCNPTLGDILQLVKSPLAFTGQRGLVASMAVLDSLGWSRNTLWETLARNPELLTWTAQELQARIYLLERVGVKKKDMFFLINDSSVFTADLEQRLAPMLQYLGAIGIQLHVLGDLMKFNPQGLIKMPLDNFRGRVDFLLELGLSTTEVERSMRVFPQLMHLRLENLSQKIEYFDSIGVDKKNMVKIVAKLPSIFRHSIDKNLVPKVQMLENLGVLRSNLVKFIAHYPQFFGCSMGNLQQKVAFFETNGLRGDRLVKMLTWHPRTFSFSVDDNLSKKLQFLVSKGFVVGSMSMVRALVSCITISTESLEARLQNLQSLGFTSMQVCDLVKKQPTICCLSEKTIRIKMDYLVNTMNRSSAEILKCPGYLLYSLEMRIKPRHLVVEMLSSKGLLRQDAYSLSSILQPSDKTFKRRFLDLHPECSNGYLEGIEGREDKEVSKVGQLVSLASSGNWMLGKQCVNSSAST